MPSTLRGLIGQSFRSSAAEKASVPSAAHQQPRQVAAPGGARGRRQRIEVVAADPAKLVREARGDLLGLPRAERAQPLASVRRCRPAHRRRDCPAARRTEAAAIGQHRVDAQHVVRHQPVADRLAAAGIVARHAADGAARRSRDRPGRTPVLLQRGVQRAEHDAGLDRRCRAAGSTASTPRRSSCSRSPARGSPSGRIGWSRRRAAGPGTPSSRRSPWPPRHRRSSRGTSTPTGSIW